MATYVSAGVASPSGKRVELATKSSLWAMWAKGALQKWATGQRWAGRPLLVAGPAQLPRRPWLRLLRSHLYLFKIEPNPPNRGTGHGIVTAVCACECVKNA